MVQMENMKISKTKKVKINLNFYLTKYISVQLKSFFIRGCTPLSAMARNFFFTPPIRLCKKFESNFFSCNWIRLINSCSVLASHPPS